MIPKKYSGDELRNRFCRPVRKIRNGGGAAVSPETICRIVDVVRGHGFTIETENVRIVDNLLISLVFPEMILNW